MVVDIVKHVFVDWSPSIKKEYNFTKTPVLEGQIGIPVIVDKLLGKMLYVIIIIKYFCENTFS